MPTTDHGLPYPDANGYVIDGAGAMQALAEAVDDELFRQRTLAHSEGSAFTGFATVVWATIADSAVAFTAPASGAVELKARVEAQVNDGKADDQARIGYDLAGPTALAPDDARALKFAVYNGPGGSTLRRLPFVSWSFFVTGLTPGGAYTATLAYRGDGIGQWYPYARQLVVVG